MVRLGIHVASGSTSKYQEIDPTRFLPFPKWKPIKPEDYSGYLTVKSEQHKLTPETKAVIIKLLNNLQLPAYVYKALMGTGQEQ